MEHVQRVLDYHNNKYGTHITICGKTQNVRPELKGKSDWDWVCCEIETSDEIAIEVKRITEQRAEERERVIYDLLHEMRIKITGRLKGYFILSVNIDEYYFPFKKHPENKQIFMTVLSDAIEKTAQRLKIGEVEDLAPQINERIPFNLPNIMFFDLEKLDSDVSVLQLNLMIGGSWSIGFNKLELEKFEGLVSHANEQLRSSCTDKTFLVLIEEGHRPINPPEIVEAFTGINARSYSEIKHVYFVRGEEVEEIPLPTS